MLGGQSVWQMHVNDRSGEAVAVRTPAAANRPPMNPTDRVARYIILAVSAAGRSAAAARELLRADRKAGHTRMSLSPELRRRAKEEALQLLLDELADGAIDCTVLTLPSQGIAELPQTTWTELEEEGLLQRDPDLEPGHCRLTGAGWRAAIVCATNLKAVDLAGRLGRLAAYFKSRIKGRKATTQVDLKTAGRESGFSEEWIFNVVESNILEIQFGRRGVHWHTQHRGRVIVVPESFGLERVPMNDSLAAKVIQLQTELAEREEQLEESMCPYVESTTGAVAVGDRG